MAVSMRWKLVAATAAVALAFGGCGGGDKEKDDDSTDAGNGGGAQDSGQNGGGASDAARDAALFEFADLDDGIAGKACSGDSECAGKGGICLDGACTGLCQNNANCGAGGTCVTPLRNQAGYCGKVCTSNDECSGGLECREGIDFGDLIGELTGELADAGIEIDAGIEARNLPKTCGQSLGTVNLPDGVVGKACTDNAQCAPGECLSEINLAERFSAGYCSGKCLTDDQCGAGGVCYKDPLTEFLKQDGRCLLACSGTATGCRNGQVCRSSAILLNSKTYCLPPEPVVDAGASDAGTTQTSDAGAADAATSGG